MSPSKLDLHSLIVFYFVASEESITSAADKLCLTQPTVTYHIRSLERAVDVKLLDVRRQKVHLTHAGVGLFRYVKEIYQQLTSAEKFLEDLREASLRVGIAASFSPIVASAAAAFEELYPHVKLIVKNASSFEIADDVLLHATKGISDLITMPGLINLDFADVKTVMRDMGKKSSASTTTHRLDLNRFLMIKRTPMTKRTNESMRSI